MAKRKAIVQRRHDGHHGCAVAICREHVPGDFSSALPVEGFRKCGGFTVEELDEFCQFWLDAYAQAYPGEMFAYESPVNGRITRSRMNLPFVAVPLPETSAEYEAECARRFALWGEPTDPLIRSLYAGYDELQRQIDGALGRNEDARP
jgi:hypothetical protein